MSSFLRLVQNEHMKVLVRPRTWVLVFLILLVEMLVALGTKFVSVSGGAQGSAWDFMNINLLWFAEVFAVIIAGDIVSSEFSWGTVKLLLIRPVNRVKILLSKYVTALVLAFLIMVFMFITSIILGVAFFGLTSFSQGMSENMPQLLQAYGLEFIQDLMIFTFAFMISTLFRSGILAIGLSIVLIFIGHPLMRTLSFFQQSWGKYILFANTDLGQYLNGNTPLFPGMTMNFSITMLVIYFAIFAFLSLFFFTKRDVSI